MVCGHKRYLKKVLGEEKIEKHWCNLLLSEMMSSFLIVHMFAKIYSGVTGSIRTRHHWNLLFDHLPALMT